MNTVREILNLTSFREKEIKGFELKTIGNGKVNIDIVTIDNYEIFLAIDSFANKLYINFGFSNNNTGYISNNYDFKFNIINDEILEKIYLSISIMNAIHYKLLQIKQDKNNGLKHDFNVYATVFLISELYDLTYDMYLIKIFQYELEKAIRL